MATMTREKPRAGGFSSPERPRRIAAEQIAVAAAQLAAGAGNLAFAMVAARLLPPGDFARLSAFLALWLLLHLPAGSLSAGAAVRPGLASSSAGPALRLGLAGAAGAAAAAAPISRALGLPVPLMLALAASVPGAALLALRRGALYGSGRYRGLVSSMAMEPAVRLTLGIPLAWLFGVEGAVAGVVAGGYAALAIAHRAGRTLRVTPPPDIGSRGPDSVPRAAPAVAAFLLLALVQNQDVVLANRLLGRPEAGLFAAVSTLGGIAAFATSTVPLVLLRRALLADRRALVAGLAVAAGLGSGVLAVTAAVPDRLAGGLLGDRYAGAGALAGRYVLAMSLLGIARVLAAWRAGTGRSRTAVAVLVAAAALQAGLILGLGRDAAAVANATLASTSAAVLALAGAEAARIPSVRRGATRALARLRSRPHMAAVAAVTLAALGLRLVFTRGLWLDEAISVAAVKLSFGEMIGAIRAGDVHPPLHAAVLWATARALGTGELAVRIPSVVAGTLLVPVLFAAGRELYDRRTGFVAAVLGAAAPLAVWYSQEARMYAMFMLFATISVWMLVRALRRGRPADWLLYAVAVAALLWTHYFAVLLVAVQQVAVALALRRPGEGSGRRRLALGWVLAVAVLAASLWPLAGIVSDQWATYQDRGAGLQPVPAQAGAEVAGVQGRPSIYGALANGVWALWGYHSDEAMVRLVALWPLGMLGALLLLGRRGSRETKFLVAGTLVPMVVLFLLGLGKRDLFELRYAIAAVPLGALLCARAVTGIRSRTLQAGAAVVLVASLLVALTDQQLNRSNPRLYDFKGALGEVKERARPGDVIVYAPLYLEPVVSYYAPGVPASSLSAGLPGPDEGKRVFLVGSFLDRKETAAAVGTAEADLRQQRHLLDRVRRPQVQVWVFE